jgi:hypothetical protein
MAGLPPFRRYQGERPQVIPLQVLAALSTNHEWVDDATMKPDRRLGWHMGRIGLRDPFPRTGAFGSVAAPRLHTESSSAQLAVSPVCACERKFA